HVRICRSILGYAEEEAERLNCRQIGPEHLLLGMLREEKSAAAQLLSRRGLKLDVIREELALNVWIVSGSAAPEGALFAFILQADGRVLSVGRGSVKP